jgi:hypothetical protein
MSWEPESEYGRSSSTPASAHRKPQYASLVLPYVLNQHHLAGLNTATEDQLLSVSRPIEAEQFHSLQNARPG